MGCNCGGNFKIDDGLEEDAVPVVGDSSYFHHGGEGATSANAEALAPTGAPVWNPETGRTEEAV